MKGPAATFIVAASVLLYVYAGYPSLMYIASRINGETRQTNLQSERAPSVTLIIAAYNEEDIIERKIENSLSIEYPGDLEIVVFSDASTDTTDEIVRSYEPHVGLKRIEGRVGKTECQNQVVAQTNSDIVVFSDANSMYDSNAITELVRGIESGADCVIGELQYQGGAVSEESLYWRIERAIKRGESATGSVVAGNGAIYAVRRESYVPLPSDEISDFAEPLAILCQEGSVEYVPSAIAVESTGESVEAELSRRIRITTRAWHTITRYSQLLSPFHRPLVAWKLFSHKILRWTSPLLLILTFVSVAWLSLSGSIVGHLLFLCQLTFVGLVVIEMINKQFIHASLSPIFSIPYYFATENYGLLIGLLNFLRGKNIVTWETEERD